MGYNSAVPSARDPESIYGVFGRRLRQLRDEKRVSQEELAILSGLTRASIANIESGRQRVLLHQILQFADALGVDLNTLIPQANEFAAPNDPGTRNSKDEFLQRLRAYPLA